MKAKPFEKFDTPLRSVFESLKLAARAFEGLKFTAFTFEVFEKFKKIKRFSKKIIKREAKLSFEREAKPNIKRERSEHQT
ncbi:MAG: hypothetical protein K9H26_19560 [Prolixibacteraceae bacterium]|nr:hypothetical protein [Prolixibacteraceae bacterium]